MANFSALAGALPQMLIDLETLVTCESPSSDRAAVARCADVVARMGRHYLGEPAERLERDGCPHLRWRLGSGPRRVLVLGHLDTVWPLGSLASHPFAVDARALRGPGCLDMKAGLVMAFHALAAVPDLDGVSLLITGDEELGSPTSRRLIEDEARQCQAALVLEAAADDGALKLERKGVSLYEVAVTGRAAHAGLEPERGVNATVELANQVQAVIALADPGRHHRYPDRDDLGDHDQHRSGRRPVRGGRPGPDRGRTGPGRCCFARPVTGAVRGQGDRIRWPESRPVGCNGIRGVVRT